MSVRYSLIVAALAALVTVTSCEGEPPLSPMTGETAAARNSEALASAAVSPQAARQMKFTICHVPPGNPDNAHEITVAEAALPAHFPHGDTFGTCEGEPPPPELCSGDCSELDEQCCVDRVDCTWTMDELENFFCDVG